ncbi:hypothetical protein LTR66_016505 [Elasticomyces elasticus]|nr:hypothetical protein LTR66_016505 [Elasticomyces elasticus]
MYMNERAIANAVGKFPTFMRPPRVLCHEGCQKDLTELGYHIAEWQYDSGDWKGNQTTPKEAIVNVDAAPAAEDWKAVPLVECLNYTLDNAFRFPGHLQYNDIKKGGCLYSAPGFCHQPKPFTDKKGCEAAHKAFMDDIEKCKKAERGYLSKPADNTCKEMERHMKEFDDFCKKCDDKKKDSCDSVKFVIKQ